MNSNKRNKALDAMRAGSVMLVVIAHAGFEFVPGGLGVTIFFVISGFIITKLIIAEIDRTGNFFIWKFYARRFWKIFPPLLAIILIPTLITWTTNQITLKQFISQILFYFNWNLAKYGSGGALPGSSVLWSLSIEEQFYILIALVTYFLCKGQRKNFKRRILCVYLLAWVISTASRIYYSYFSQIPAIYDETGNLPRIYLGTDTRMSSICAGAILSILTTNTSFMTKVLQISNKKIVVANLFLLFILIFSLIVRQQGFRDTLRFSIQELAICWIILIGPVLERLHKQVRAVINWRLIQLIGHSSYCIYLSHSIVIFVSVKYNYFFDSNLVEIAKILNILLSSIFGILIYRIVDKPFERVRTKLR